MTKQIFAFIGACALLTAPVLAADSIDAIVANPSAFDGKHVSVHGSVADVKQKTSRKGNDYTTFQVCETKCVNVYAHGHVGVTEARSSRSAARSPPPRASARSPSPTRSKPTTAPARRHPRRR